MPPRTTYRVGANAKTALSPTVVLNCAWYRVGKSTEISPCVWLRNHGLLKGRQFQFAGRCYNSNCTYPMHYSVSQKRPLDYVHADLLVSAKGWLERHSVVENTLSTSRLHRMLEAILCSSVAKLPMQEQDAFGVTLCGTGWLPMISRLHTSSLARCIWSHPVGYRVAQSDPLTGQKTGMPRTARFTLRKGWGRLDEPPCTDSVCLRWEQDKSSCTAEELSAPSFAHPLSSWHTQVCPSRYEDGGHDPFRPIRTHSQVAFFVAAHFFGPPNSWWGRWTQGKGRDLSDKQIRCSRLEFHPWRRRREWNSIN